MRQKYSITVAGVSMNIVCEETRETVDAAVNALNAQIGNLTASSACTRTEATLLAALDAITKSMHQEEKIKELDVFLHRADPAGDNFEASLLRGENETLRAELQVSRGAQDAMLEDNATLFRLNAKLEKQNAESNARADRMHDQVLAVLTEVRDLREKLAAMCTDSPVPAPSYQEPEPAPQIEITPEETRVTEKYGQIELPEPPAAQGSV